MGFEKFGIVSFTNESRVSQFVNDLEQGKIRGTECQVCGAQYFPPQAECSKCLSNKVGWFEMGSKGRLLTYTVVRYGPAGFENMSPYILAIGEFGSGLKILAHLDRSISEKDIQIGMRLKVIPIGLNGERVSYGFQRL